MPLNWINSNWRGVRFFEAPLRKRCGPQKRTKEHGRHERLDLLSVQVCPRSEAEYDEDMNPFHRCRVRPGALLAIAGGLLMPGCVTSPYGMTPAAPVNDEAAQHAAEVARVTGLDLTRLRFAVRSFLLGHATVPGMPGSDSLEGGWDFALELMPAEGNPPRPTFAVDNGTPVLGRWMFVINGDGTLTASTEMQVPQPPAEPAFERLLLTISTADYTVTGWTTEPLPAEPRLPGPITEPSPPPAGSPAT